jgi:hypothetical protein
VTSNDNEEKRRGEERWRRRRSGQGLEVTRWGGKQKKKVGVDIGNTNTVTMGRGG